MKLKVNIQKVAQNRGVNNPYQLQKRVGLSPSNAVKLYNNDIVQISINTLSKLCETLDCEPNDLFVKPKSKTKLKNQ